MAAKMPQFLFKSFAVANQPQNSTDESAYYGPYTRLLYHLFGIDGDFEIRPQFHVPYTARDVVATFTIEYSNHPVMFIQVKPPGTFDNDSNRKEADDQMRHRFRVLSLRRSLVTPRIPAVSAKFGTRLAFYEYVAATNAVMPPAIPADPTYLTDVAPADDGTMTSLMLLASLDFVRKFRTSSKCARLERKVFSSM